MYSSGQGNNTGQGLDQLILYTVDQGHKRTTHSCINDNVACLHFQGFQIHKNTSSFYTPEREVDSHPWECELLDWNLTVEEFVLLLHRAKNSTTNLHEQSGSAASGQPSMKWSMRWAGAFSSHDSKCGIMAPGGWLLKKQPSREDNAARVRQHKPWCDSSANHVLKAMFYSNIVCRTVVDIPNNSAEVAVNMEIAMNYATIKLLISIPPKPSNHKSSQVACKEGHISNTIQLQVCELMPNAASM